MLCINNWNNSTWTYHKDLLFLPSESNPWVSGSLCPPRFQVTLGIIALLGWCVTLCCLVPWFLLLLSEIFILPWVGYFQRADLVNSLFQNLVDLFLFAGWSPNHPKQPLKPSLIWNMATSPIFPTCPNSSYLIKTILCCSSTDIVKLCLCISPSPGCESSSSSWRTHPQCF